MVSLGFLSIFSDDLRLPKAEPQSCIANCQVLIMTKRTAAEDKARNEEVGLQLDQPTRQRVEETLTRLGYDAGPSDGVFDDRTRTAIRGFQKEWHFVESGYLDEVTFVRLLAIGIY